MFWELDRNPWVVRNLLDNFVRHYSYVDTVGGPGEDPPGVSIPRPAVRRHHDGPIRGPRRKEPTWRSIWC